MNEPNALSSFERAAQSEFRFLVNRFGAGPPEVTRPDPFTLHVTYRNSTTGVRVSFEQRENQVFAYLIRLRDGQVPPYFRHGADWAYVDHLVSRIGDGVPRKPPGQWLTSGDVHRALAIYAKTIREHGAAILKGDFSDFERINAVTTGNGT